MAQIDLASSKPQQSDTPAYYRRLGRFLWSSAANLIFIFSFVVYPRESVNIRGGGLRKRQSHAVIIRPTTTLGGNPTNDLIRDGGGAGLAVHTVRWIQADALP